MSWGPDSTPIYSQGVKSAGSGEMKDDWPLMADLRAHLGRRMQYSISNGTEVSFGLAGFFSFRMQKFQDSVIVFCA
jgi:hypothetical protein